MTNGNAILHFIDLLYHTFLGATVGSERRNLIVASGDVSN